LTKAPVQISGSGAVEDVLDVAVKIDDDGRRYRLPASGSASEALASTIAQL
jgi:hypothetical protein